MYVLQGCDPIVLVLTFATMNRLIVNVLAKANEEFNMYSQFNSIVITNLCIVLRLAVHRFVHVVLGLTHVLGYARSVLYDSEAVKSNNAADLLLPSTSIDQ